MRWQRGLRYSLWKNGENQSFSRHWLDHNLPWKYQDLSFIWSKTNLISQTTYQLVQHWFLLDDVEEVLPPKFEKSHATTCNYLATFQDNTDMEMHNNYFNGVEKDHCKLKNRAAVTLVWGNFLYSNNDKPPTPNKSNTTLQSISGFFKIFWQFLKF